MVKIKKKHQLACLNCGNTWLADKEPAKNAQCAKCWAYAVISIEKYNEVAKQLRAIATTRELRKFKEIYDFLKSEGIIVVSRYIKYTDIKVNEILAKALETSES